MSCKVVNIARLSDEKIQEIHRNVISSTGFLHTETIQLILHKGMYWIGYLSLDWVHLIVLKMKEKIPMLCIFVSFACHLSKSYVPVREGFCCRHFWHWLHFMKHESLSLSLLHAMIENPITEISHPNDSHYFLLISIYILLLSSERLKPQLHI